MKYVINIVCFVVFLIVPSSASFSQDAGISPPAMAINIPEPKMRGDDVLVIDDDNSPPDEPVIPQVTFLNDALPKSLQERINRMIHGIETDVPPEYDIYGYEIRRYMAQIGNEKIYTDERFLISQINNIRKAHIISEYWEKALNKEIQDCENEVSANEVASIVRTTLRQNKVTVRGFFIELKKWLDTNEELLKGILQRMSSYQFEYPELIFLEEAKERTDLYDLMIARRNAVLEIHKYGPFAGMIY